MSSIIVTSEIEKDIEIKKTLESGQEILLLLDQYRPNEIMLKFFSLVFLSWLYYVVKLLAGFLSARSLTTNPSLVYITLLS